MRLAWDVLETLPDSEAAYKIKLFAATRQSEVFSEELKSLVFRLFETKFDSKNIFKVLRGSEYYEALQVSFEKVDWKREYINNLFPFFTKAIKETDDDKDKNLFQLEFSRICSSVQKSLTSDEVEECARLTGNELIQNFDPAITRSGVVMSGTVVHKPPITAEELDRFSFSELIKKLKGEWSPKKIEERKHWESTSLREYGVRGLGDYLTARVQNNFAEAVTFAPQFFDPKNIHSHYTASFFEGIRNALKETGNKGVDLGHLFSALKDIREQDIIENDEEEKGRWLESWTWVYDILAEVVGELITEKGLSVEDFKNYRIELLETIEFLLNHHDPSFEEESKQIERITSEKKENKNVANFDPISTAINSVRGRAFEVFVNFIYRDNNINGEEPYLSEEVKVLYKKLLEKESSRAIMAMFGRYFSVVYFRDSQLAISLLDNIFPKTEDNKELYRAAWGGYLTTNLFIEIFNDKCFQPLYKRWLKDGVHKDEFERYERDADKGVATHLALAYIYIDDFTLEHELFLEIWKDDVPKTIKEEFISFVGSVIYGRSSDLSKIQASKLEKFWDWALKNLEAKKLFKNFGTWVEPKLFKDIDGLQKRLAATLVKSQGELNIDYKFTEYARIFAENNPDQFLDMAESYFLLKLKNKTIERPLWIEKGWQEAFSIVYKNSDKGLQAKAKKLVSDLILHGGREFWPLEDAVLS